MGVTAAFGGLKDAPAKQLEQLGKGAEVDQVRMRTKFEDAVVRPGGKDGIGTSDKRYLQIIMKVTNQSDATMLAQIMDDALPTVRADGKTLKPAADPDVTLGPRVVVVSGGHAYDQLHPGMTATVVMAFELASGQPAPERVVIGAATYEWYESFFSETHYWVPVTEEAPLTAEDRKKGRTVRYEPVIDTQVSLPVREEAQ